ncbi:MAG: AsmA-like C-terminal domain-containing protein, partial [Deltaproteobacteria bacterium]|nr:AsmA-like C-terminal domain-containing protein [Deltaproteobacteria bacterium]
EIVRLKAGLGSVLTQQVQGRLHSWLHQPVLTLEDRFDLTLAAADPEALRFVENTTALLRPRLPEVAAFLAGSEVLTGRAQVSLRLRWPLGGPVASWELGGRLQDVSLENTAFVRPLAMINGGFKLYADRLVFEEMSCRLGDSPVKLDGRIDNYRDWRHCLLDLSLEAPAIQPLDFTIIPWLTVAAGGAADVPHASSIKLAVSGSPGDWQHLRLHGRVDLRHLDLSISPYCRRLDDLTLAAVFAGQEVEVRELTCHCLTSDLRLRGRGRWQPENYRLAVNLESNRLVLDDLICPQRQELVLDLAALYRSLQDSWEEFSFQAGIKKLRLPTVFGSRYPRDFHDVSWDLAYRADELQLKKLCFSRQLSDVKLTGRLRLDEKGAVDGSLEHYSSYLDYNDFLPAAAGRPPAEAAAADEPQKPVLLTRLRRWCQGNSLVLVSRIDHLAGKGIEIGHLDGEIQVARNFLLLKSLTGHLWGGEGKIRGIWSLQDNSFSLTTDLTGINVKNVNDLLSLYPEKSLPLRGTGDVNLALKWQGDTYEQWRRHLNGWIKFAFAKGRLLRFTALANIFSLLNVSQLFSLNLPNLSTDGLPYDRFSGSFKVKDGVLSTEDILVRGPAMNISAAGDISLPRRWVDMEVSVQPLQTVGKTIAMIPIIGYIITGEGKTLIAMNFTVKGPFGKTKVESIPFRGLVSKSGEILKRLIGTPVRILSWPGKFFSSPGKEAEGARDDQAGRNVPDQGQEKEDKP